MRRRLGWREKSNSSTVFEFREAGLVDAALEAGLATMGDLVAGEGRAGTAGRTTARARRAR